MGLRIDTISIGPGIVVVLLSGSATRCPESSGDELFIQHLLKRGERKLIIDLTGVGHMDSSGAQMMYACYSAARVAGGEVRFVGANAKVARLFEITRLDLVLPFYPTVAAARENFVLQQKMRGS